MCEADNAELSYNHCPEETEILTDCVETPLIEPGQQEINDNFVGTWCWNNGAYCGEMTKSAENPAEFKFETSFYATATMTQRGSNVLYTDNYGCNGSSDCVSISWWVLRNSLTDIQYVG